MESHISHHELHGAVSHHTEVNAAQYERFSEHRKLVIIAVLSLCGFLAPISSTSILSAVPEVAVEYQTTGSFIDLSNAFHLIAIGLSPCLWGPLSQVYGRRWVCRRSLRPCEQGNCLHIISDMHNHCRTVLRLLRRHSTSSKSGVLFYLSHLGPLSKALRFLLWVPHAVVISTLR